MKKLILALLLAVAAPAWATTIYACACATGADNKCVAGSDSNDGLTDLTPKLSLTAAITATGGSARVLNLCTGGRWANSATTLSSTITVGSYFPKTCKEGCRLRKPVLAETRSGFNALNITGAGTAVRDISVQGGGTGQTGITSSVAATIERVTIEGFTTAGYSCTAGVPKVLNNTISSNTNGIVSGCSDILIERNRLDNNASAACVESPGSCTAKHAMVLNGPFITGRGVVVRNNKITRTGNLSGGRCGTAVIVAGGRHKGLTIEDNEIVETTPTTACSHISLQDSFGSGSGVEGFVNTNIRGNLVANAGGTGILVVSCQACNIENNMVVRTTDIGGAAAAENFTAIAVASHGTGDLASQNVWVRNNSVYLAAATAGSKAIAINAGTEMGITSNLIHLGSSNAATQCFDTTGLTPAGNFTAVNYNLCYRTGGTAKYSQAYASITAARAATPAWDTNGSAADPMLIAPPTLSTNWTMAVNAGAPTINAAEAGRAARIAYKNHPPVGARDIGAEEYEAQGKTYIVATTGSDSNNGLTVATPFLTIQHALDIVNPGDTIAVRAGTYNQRLIASRPGVSTARITLRGYAKEMPILRGTTAGPTLYFYTQACEDMVTAEQSGNTDCTPMYWTVTGLEIRGSATGAEDGNAVKIDTPKVRLQGNRICCSYADVVKLVRTANDAEVLDNEIWQDSAISPISENAQGVDSVGTDRIRVAGNYVHDITSIGMYCKGNCRSAIFENNRIHNISDHGMMMGQETDEELLLDGTYEAYDGIMRNNVVSNTDRACFAISSAYNIKALNNSCYNTGRVQHGSVFLSNESIIGQSSENIEIANNIVYGSPTLPIIKITADALTDFSTLSIHDNIYWRADGAPTFTPNAEFAPVTASNWFIDFGELTGNTDNSRVLNPLYKSTTGKMAMVLSDGSPAINMGAAHASVTKDFTWLARPVGPKPEIGAYEYTRTALADTTAPTITLTSPASAATFVAVASTISATFSEAIDCATVTTGSFTVSGSVTGSVSCDGSVALFTPSANLNYSTTYTVTLSTAVKDIAGNVLSGTRSWSFTTVAAPAEGYTFNFLVYGDSRAGNVCDGNTVHLGLVSQMAAETASFVIHVGDMIAGLYNTTNWTNRGGCPGGTSLGSLQEMIAPLKGKTPAAGLSSFFYPVIGNHDAGWGSGWYPDPYGQGVCSLFDIQALGVQNHTTKSYFLDKTGRVPLYSDAEFYSLACSTTNPAVYDVMMYYSFKFMNSVFVVMRLNDDNHDLMDCGTCSGNLSNYDHYYYKHQLDWLNYTLAAAQADGSVQNIFVFTHAPLMTRSEHPPMASWPTMRYTLSNYAKVKAVFSGHNHVYERSYPTYATVGAPVGVRNDTTGVVYYTTGGGGSPLNSFIRTESLMATGTSIYHYMKVEVNGSAVTTKAINQAGTVFDEFTR